MSKLMLIIPFIIYSVAIAIAYFVIKLAVKHAILESKREIDTWK